VEVPSLDRCFTRLHAVLSISEMFIRGIKDRSRWDAQEEGGQ